MERLDGEPLWKALEREAVEEAMRGKVGKLADLLRSNHPLNRGPNPIRDNLAPATRKLIADFLTGKRNRKTGKLKS